MENREKIKMRNQFDDLSDCTGYYLEELGKLDSFANESSELTRKEKKRLHNYITFFFFEALETLKNKAKSNKMVNKTEINEFNKEFKETHESHFKSFLKSVSYIPKIILKGTNNIIKLITKDKKQSKIEIVSETEQQLNNIDIKVLENSQSCENIKENDDISLSESEENSN